MQREEHSSFTLVALKGPSSMGMIRLIDSLMQSEETDFRVEIVNEPIQVRKRMLDGSADFVILPTTMAALTYNKGLEYQLIAIPVWGTLYLTGTDTSLFGWNLLKGKKVHSMARGMSPDVVFRHLLNKNGLDTENDVTLDYRFPTHIDLAHAVAAGQAGYAILSEPQLSVAMHRNPDLKPLLNLNEAWMQHHGAPMAQTAFMGKKEVVQTNRQRVEELISAYEASTRWVNQYPDSAAALIVQYDILPDSVLARGSVPRSNLHFVRAKEIQQQIEDYLNVFYAMDPDIIGGKLPDEDFIYK